MKPKSGMVIGAGVGGITAATHLARQGIKVTVLEKTPRPGGGCDASVVTVINSTQDRL